jgi:SAM-dependent methyltransferase
MSEPLDELHAPLLPVLRHVLALAPLPRAGLAIDLGCGPGRKMPLLAAALGPGVRLVGVDRSLSALRAASSFRQGRGIEDGRSTSATPRSPIPDPRSPILSSPLTGIVGDALALPLRDDCCDAAFCIAALGLFGDRRAALCELRRVLRPGAPALLVVGAQIWAQAVPWPADLSACLVAAYERALAQGAAPLAATPDLAGELAELLGQAGFMSPHMRAFWLDRPQLSDAAALPREALSMELPLLPWRQLRALLAGRLGRETIALADEVAAGADVELCELALAALARAT